MNCIRGKRGKRYKPNCVYGLLLDKNNYYIGCHCSKSKYLTNSSLVNTSGNYLASLAMRGEISWKEHHSRVEILFVEEFDNPEEALNREEELIKEWKDKYRSACINKGMGNKYGPKGTKHPHSEEHRKKISDAQRGKTGHCKNHQWFTNGIVNTRQIKCPEGFWKGITKLA